MKRAVAVATNVAVFAGLVVGAGVLASAQQPLLPSEPPRGFGASVTGAFEGWFQNADGSYAFLVGYLNRNRARAVDVPIGPNNRMEPGGPDLGQPTHFRPGRHVGVFLVTVPKDFTPQQRITWTITVNGVANSIPLRLHTDYNVSPFKIQHDAEGGQGNTPPVLRLEEPGTPIQGPVAMLSRPALTRTTRVGTPLTLTFSTEDDARYSSGSNAPMNNPPPPVQITWSKYRGPGAVSFGREKPELEKLAGGAPNQPFRGRGATTATFSEPGEYVLHALASDYSGEGGGGEICCWTTALVKVTVTP